MLPPLIGNEACAAPWWAGAGYEYPLLPEPADENVENCEDDPDPDWCAKCEGAISAGDGPSGWKLGAA